MKTPKPAAKAAGIRTRGGDGKFTPLDKPPAAVKQAKGKMMNEGTRLMTAAERQAEAAKQLRKGKQLGKEVPLVTP